jgi:hypothetical protein
MRSKLLFAWMMLFLSVLSFAQGTDLPVVTGVVRDEHGGLLQGITVAEKGTRNMVITNVQGVFSIRVKSANVTLVLTGVGFEKQELKAAGNTSFDVVLKADVKSLSDVVVVGYGTQKKAKVTGAVATLTMDSVLGDRPVTSLGALLQGATPCLQVTINSGQPWAGTAWNIRGHWFWIKPNIPFQRRRAIYRCR